MSGVYQCILADPPWRYEHARTTSRRVERHYPTMALEEIERLPVAQLADPAGCVLFLWATNPKLPEALSVMRAWGFKYRTSAVWVKPQIGMGYYVRASHEPLLIGTRGDAHPPKPANRPRSVLIANRTAHSEKPDLWRARIEAMYPDARRVELFARTQRNGWDTWGDEVPCSAGTELLRATA